MSDAHVGSHVGFGHGRDLERHVCSCKIEKNDYGLTSLTEVDELRSGDDSQDGNVAWKSVSYD